MPPLIRQKVVKGDTTLTGADSVLARGVVDIRKKRAESAKASKYKFGQMELPGRSFNPESSRYDTTFNTALRDVKDMKIYFKKKTK